MIDVDRLYKDITGQTPEPGLTADVTKRDINGFKIPSGATVTYRPESRPYDLLVKCGINSIGINAEGPLMTDVASNAPDDFSDMVRKAISPYAS